MSCKYYFFVKLLLKTVLKNLFFTVKLNGGRNIVGILRGFDPFMNLVIDETVEEVKDGSKNNIGMVVCLKLTWYT